jgi:PTH1 family peptidyl-tRNA hydrolase
LKLIVGLGNPGSEYADTRHNVGFKVVEELARRHNSSLRSASRWGAKTGKVLGVGAGFVVAQPTTFMNLSGHAVQALAAFHKVLPEDVLVVVDDADLPLGKLRIRTRGSAGGHNGLKSIIQELGTNEFPRLRIGVGRQPGELRKHVLGRFGETERQQIAEAVKRAADAAEMFVTDGVLRAMNTFNAPESGPEPEAREPE